MTISKTLDELASSAVGVPNPLNRTQDSPMNNRTVDNTMSDIERHHTNARMSKIVCHGGIVYLCGLTAKGSPSATGNIYTQTAEVLSRIDTLLAEAGSHRTRLLTATIYLRDIADFAGMNVVWEAWLEGKQAGAPARTTVQASLATESLLVEMTIVAAEE